MPENKQEPVWPMPQYRFKATIGKLEAVFFEEVSGLDTEYDIIEYRSVHAPEFSPIKMPGIKKYESVILKKGKFQDDASLFDYFSRIKMNTVAPETMTVQLIDKEDKTLFTWTLTNAFPQKISGVTHNAKTSEAAVEELVIVHEGISIN